jgi:hypothetical protein
MKKMMNSSPIGVLRKMIQIDQFYPAVGWVVSFHNVGMDYQQSKFLWKCMVAPHLVDLHDDAQFVLSIPHLSQKFGKLQGKSFIIIFAKKMSK